MIPTWLTDSVTPDLDRALHYTLLWGLEAVELRMVGRHGERVPFVNEARLRRRLEENEIPVAAIDPGLFAGPVEDRSAWMNELSSFAETLDFCRRIACSRVIVSGFASPVERQPEAAGALRRAADLAARAGVRLIVFHAGETCAPDVASLASLLALADHPALGAGWDPASALVGGEAAEAGARALAGRIGYVRCTDVAQAGKTWKPASFGEGRVGWDAIVRGLAGAGYDGPMSLSMEVEPRPKEGLRAATRLHQFIQKYSPTKQSISR